METALSLVVGCLFAVALYLLLSKHIIRMLLGVVLLGPLDALSRQADLAFLNIDPQDFYLYLVTDSESSFNQMRAKLPDGLTTSMLYRDYLGNFRINTLEAYR